MKKKLIIYGASGHGKVIADIARLNGYEDIVFYDDDPLKSELGEYRVIHESDFSDCDLFIAVGDNETREFLSRKCNKELITLVHPSAVVARDAVIGQGTVVMAGAVINPGTVIEEGCIVNTCASVDHDNLIGAYSHLSVNSHTAGTVTIGKKVFLGIGSSVINNVNICDDVLVGAGAVVVSDINEPGTYIGVPARKK